MAAGRFFQDFRGVENQPFLLRIERQEGLRKDFEGLFSVRSVQEVVLWEPVPVQVAGFPEASLLEPGEGIDPAF